MQECLPVSWAGRGSRVPQNPPNTKVLCELICLCARRPAATPAEKVLEMSLHVVPFARSILVVNCPPNLPRPRALTWSVWARASLTEGRVLATRRSRVQHPSILRLLEELLRGARDLYTRWQERTPIQCSCMSACDYNKLKGYSTRGAVLSYRRT